MHWCTSVSCPLSFKGHTKLFDPHRFKWETTTPQEGVWTRKFLGVLLDVLHRGSRFAVRSNSNHHRFAVIANRTIRITRPKAIRITAKPFQFFKSHDSRHRPFFSKSLRFNSNAIKSCNCSCRKFLRIPEGILSCNCILKKNKETVTVVPINSEDPWEL